MEQAGKIWESREVDHDAIRDLAESLKLHEPIARILVGRGITDQAVAEKFLDSQLSSMSDPSLLRGMRRACERIERALRKGEKIIAWGDYDADGITSLALLVRFFRQIPFPIETEIPRRIEDGYGLQDHSVRELAQRGAKLIITVDNGISSVDEVVLANRLGVDVIVVDHHEIGDSLPDAAAIINPKHPECKFPHDNPAAVGLTFLLLAGLRRHLVSCGLLAREPMPNLKELLDIVAIGTIADMVPLDGINRLFVQHGLPILSRSIRPGILALKEASGMGVDGDVDSYDVGFKLAPQINAGGRIGDAKAGVELLATDDLAKARTYARQLYKRNQARKIIQGRVLHQALEMLESDPNWRDSPAIIIAGDDWHEGVIGLVASRLVEQTNKPSIVISVSEGEMGKASCRSIPALNMHDALSGQERFLERFGGHTAAAGFSIRRENIEEFKESFLEYVAGRLTKDDYLPRLLTDGECPLSMLDYGFLDQLERLAPFGIGNPSPLFVARGVEVARVRILKDKHLKLGLNGKERIFDAIAFGMGGVPIKRGDSLDIAYSPEYNKFRGTKTMQLKIKDLKWSE